MTLHVIVGAGPVGSLTATLLARSGEEVRIISTSSAWRHHDPISPRSAALERPTPRRCGTTKLHAMVPPDPRP
jgi:2-polyprenyl-6-methoxyphenol hydroxylase-like FAD-dependent oxidoreductase